MKTLPRATRKRIPRALNATTLASAGDMTGLMPFFVDEEEPYLQMYPAHKPRRD